MQHPWLCKVIYLPNSTPRPSQLRHQVAIFGNWVSLGGTLPIFETRKLMLRKVHTTHKSLIWTFTPSPTASHCIGLYHQTHSIDLNTRIVFTFRMFDLLLELHVRIRLTSIKKYTFSFGAQSSLHLLTHICDSDRHGQLFLQ